MSDTSNNVFRGGLILWNRSMGNGIGLLRQCLWHVNLHRCAHRCCHIRCRCYTCLRVWWRRWLRYWSTFDRCLRWLILTKWVDFIIYLMILSSTASQKEIHPFGSVGYEIGVFWAKITYLKSAGMLFFKCCAKRYDLGLSNEPLFIITAQEATKLWPVKVRGPK